MTNQMNTNRATATAPTRPAWLKQTEFPFTSRRLAIDGHLIHYLDEGAGPTMVFVHAGPAWSFVYRDLIVRLRDRFRCVALDLPGTGLSRAATGYRPSIQAGAAVFSAVVRALDLRQLTLVTHDVGTPVALGAAVGMPERVVALSVTEGFAWALADEHPRTARTLRIVGSRPVGVLNDAFNLLGRVTASRAGAGRHLSAAGRRALLGPYRERAVRRSAAAMLGDAADAAAYLRWLDAQLPAALGDRPVQLVFGSASPTVREHFPQRWRARYPNAQLVLVPGAHHFPMNDAPELVADTISSWWTATVASPEGSP
jgi:haloalkane dehalogenase